MVPVRKHVQRPVGGHGRLKAATEADTGVHHFGRVGKGTGAIGETSQELGTHRRRKQLRAHVVEDV